ncbi:MAG: hypothetical protein PWQ39_151 [Thermacetogenium sp.]|nr:hypothetical protein [Thermacetogenium sp.]
MSIFKNERGSVLSIEFLIVAMLLIFLVFGATDYWLLQVKMQQAEHIKNYYLDRIRVEGCLTSSDQAEMISRFQQAGFTVESIDAPTTRILRNIEDPTASEVWLRVDVKLNQKPFLLGSLLGEADHNGLIIKVAGRGLSERVDP